MTMQFAGWLRVVKLSTTRRSQSGFATVEFAITIPLLVMVTVLGMWLIGLTVTDLRLHSAALSSVRILARGQGLTQDFLQGLPAQAQYEVIQDETLVRINIRMKAQSPIPAIPLPLTLTATAVAALEDSLSGY